MTFQSTWSNLLEEHLSEPLTLADAIAELEMTIAVYEQTDVGA